MDNLRIFRILNSVMIVDNGIKKIINDKNIITKSDSEILAIYNNNKKRGDDK